jgi:hypothetical protein
VPPIQLLTPFTTSLIMDTNNDFQKAAQRSQSSLVGEFIGFLKRSRKFWLLPLIVIMLLLAMVLVLGGSAVAPFIYTLF